MFFSNKAIVASLFVIASSFVNAAPTNSTAYTTTVKSQNDFCLFLPPQPGLVVAVNENNGIPFCVKQNSVPHAKAFPSGFITTAHYLKSSSYVQVTGFFDRTKYKLGANDGGGQYDNHAKGKPVGAQCTGYKYFVSLIEPDIERFCIRCCQDKADCNTGRSGYGCLRVVDGDYTRDNNFGSKSKKATEHANTHFNSVLTDLDALPSSDNAGDSTDNTDDSAANADYSTDNADDSTDNTDDSTDSSDNADYSIDNGDDSTDNADDSTDNADDSIDNADDSTDNATSTTDSVTSNASSATSNTGSSITANQEIASEIALLENDLTSGHVSVDQVQNKWNNFSAKLSSEYPQISEQINQLNTITTGLTTTEQWSAFISLVTEKILQLQDSAVATTTATSDDASTTTHTNSNEDLKWLFDHRNSHDNQATW